MIDYKALLMDAPDLHGNDWSSDEILLFLERWKNWRDECAKQILEGECDT